MSLHGIGVGRGIAFGPVLRMGRALLEPEPLGHSGDPAAEFATVLAAITAVAADLDALGVATGGDALAVLEAQAMMATDPTLVDDIRARIDAGHSGERAVFEACAAFEEVFRGLGGLMAERASDLADVAQRVIARLRGVPAPALPRSSEPFILIAADLAPADTAQLDHALVLGLVTEGGGPTSHTAILARAKSIPAIVGVSGLLELADGTIIIADAATGEITVSPSEAAIAAASARRAELAAALVAPITEGALADGTRIPLLANLGSPRDAAAAVALGAEGVGLFRTELLFLGAATAPAVAEQQALYVELLSHFPGRRVVVRTLDAGADKPLGFLGGHNSVDNPSGANGTGSAHETNPALGVRGLRALRASEHVLRDQLAALAGAVRESTAGAELWVMAPMVSDAEETEYFVNLCRDFGLANVGVMAEVPSLAVLADQVAAVCDFVSVGTNDLTQYTLAADRQLAAVSSYQDPWHPAVLRLVKMLGDAGAAAGKPVGICGEAAADPELAVVLVGLGATTLSMTPAALAAVRAELLTVTLEQARKRAAAALNAHTAATARAAAAV